MLRFFRGLSNSRIGTWAVAIVGIGILVGFAMGDLSNVGTGNIGFGMGASTLAEAGKQEVTDREMNDAMQRRLQEVRGQNPTATPSSPIRPRTALFP